MSAKKKTVIAIFSAAALLIALISFLYGSYRRPYREEVRGSGVNEALVFAVMKAESGFREDVKSRAGAVGMMQLLPSTAQFICEREGLEFYAEKLTDGAYNVRLGCLYLHYLLEKFDCKETAVAAYNAGEGVVAEWLAIQEYSDDGVRLKKIPYPETQSYVKKIVRFEKGYTLLYGKGLGKI